jgi:hypothetical protein
VAFVKGVTGNATSGTTTGTFTGSTTSGNLIVVTTSDDSGTTSNGVSVTDNKGNTYTKVHHVASASTLSMWYAANVTGGASHTVTATWSTSATGRLTLVAQEFDGGFTTLDKSTSATGSSTSPSSGATATTTAASETVVGGVSYGGTATTVTLGSGYTNLNTVSVADAGIGQESKVVSSTGAQTATFSLAASRSWIAGVLTFSGASGATASAGVATATATAPSATAHTPAQAGAATGTGTAPTPSRRVAASADAATASATAQDAHADIPGAALTAAIDDSDRVIVYTLEVDWARDDTWDHTLTDVTAWVTDLSIERVATGDLPSEATLVEGFVAARLTATLGGLDETGLELTGKDGTSALDVFAPYRSDSPLYQRAVLGCGVRCEIGLVTDDGPELIRQFTGQLRSLAPDSRSREVTLGALDSAEQLRAPITLPAHSLSRADILASGHDQILINSQAVVDFVLRRNGIYASPPVHENCQLSCTGHGWLAAEVGRSAVPRGVLPRVGGNGGWWVDDDDHPFGMLAVRGDWDDSELYQEFFAATSYVPTAGNGIGFACWARVGNDMGLASNRTLFQFSPLVTTNAVTFELNIAGDGTLGGYVSVSGVYSGATVPITTPTAWMYLGVHFQHLTDGTTTVRLRQNGATTSGSVTSPTLSSSVSANPLCTAWTSARDWSNFQVWYSYAPPGTWPGETHTPQATLDRGLGLLTYLPDVVEQESLEVAKAVTTAEFALFGFDAEGVPFFRARSTSTDPTTVDKTITADRALLDLAAEVNADSIRNVISTESKMGTLSFTAKAVEAREADEYDTPVGVWTYDVPLPFSAIATTNQAIPRIASASWADTVLNGFVSVQAASPSTEITSGISVTATMLADRLIRLTVRNYSGFGVRFATTSGSPALRVQGWGLTLEPAQIYQERAEGSIALYDERVYKISPTDWRQYPPTMRDIAGGLLATLAQPMPTLANVPIVGDPTMEPGDVVRLVDEQGQGDFRAYVVGVRHSLTGGTLRTELTARPIVSPGLGLLDDLELGILDSSLVLAP